MVDRSSVPCRQYTDEFELEEHEYPNPHVYSILVSLADPRIRSFYNRWLYL